MPVCQGPILPLFPRCLPLVVSAFPAVCFLLPSHYPFPGIGNYDGWGWGDPLIFVRRWIFLFRFVSLEVFIVISCLRVIGRVVRLLPSLYPFPGIGNYDSWGRRSFVFCRMVGFLVPVCLVGSLHCDQLSEGYWSCCQALAVTLSVPKI